MSNQSIPAAYPSRSILDGVPRIGFDVHLSPFPGTLYAILAYFGNQHDYDYLMGVTGAAFRRLWNRDDGGNVGLCRLGDEPFRRIFAALGYEWHVVPPERDAMLQAIRESIARGVPPISFGILAPPEAGIVTGYDQDGAVLYGWSYFQPDGSRYFEKSDWFETMAPADDRGLIVIGDKTPTIPSGREVLVSSLEWAIDLECAGRPPNLPDHVSGLAAYDGWASGLEVDADYPVTNPDVRNLRAMIHGDQCIMLEERRDAARFLRRMQAFAPEAAGHLEAAAALYDEVAAEGSALWPWPGADHTGAIQPLADPHTRRELAGHVRAAREKEARAVTFLEKALAALN